MAYGRFVRAATFALHDPANGEPLPATSLFLGSCSRMLRLCSTPSPA
jgi:hypothetical protein